MPERTKGERDNTMAEPKSKVASLNPDTYAQGGLPDDFDGQIARARYVPWTYPDRSIDHYVLALKVDFAPDPDSGFEPFSEYFGAGNKSLFNFVPSMDGENPAGQTLEVYRQLATGEVDIDKEDEVAMGGVYAKQIGKAEVLNTNSKLSEFTTAIHEVVKSANANELVAAGWQGWTASTECMEGLYGHFNRIQGKALVGLPTDGKGKKPTLVMTELKPRPKTAGVVKPIAKTPTAVPTPASAPAQAQAAASPASDGSLSERVAAEVVDILRANEGGLNRLKFAPLVMQKFAGSSDVGPAIKLLTPQFFTEYAEGRWAFDPDSGLVVGLG
jgi:hypothetical protein